MALQQERGYTVDDIYTLPDGKRAELIDGRIYDMAPPVRIHQKLITEFVSVLHSHIKNNTGQCEVYPAPFAVFLNEDNRNYVEPDISIIYDKSKLTDKGCSGALDLIIEIVSPKTQQVDHGIKLFKYRTAGVREYWIVNPTTNIVNVYDFENEIGICQYHFHDEIPVCIFHNLSIRISDFW
ncbi:Uma2 family endonuclease [Parablautia muri]|uniref:Uma2 family endonuclease n=1 Tax=Parablautia muri TaxID=2320879 RepID=A0A9X5GR82_9FIRM|nr:Uma2 family endonuclease [Parablautia muri]NBJ92049.1 Uma2 family endonuclease [Parablautia muri]